MKYCSKCGKQLDDDAWFCKYCGNIIDDPKEKKKEQAAGNRSPVENTDDSAGNDSLPRVQNPWDVRSGRDNRNSSSDDWNRQSGQAGWNQQGDSNSWNRQNGQAGWNQQGDSNGWNRGESGQNGWNRQNGQNQNPYQPWDSYPPQYRSGGSYNGYCVASLVLGIVGFFVNLFFITPVLGLVFGLVGYNQVKHDPYHRYSGSGMAIAGIVCSIAAIIVNILMIVFLMNNPSLFGL